MTKVFKSRDTRVPEQPAALRDLAARSGSVFRFFDRAGIPSGTDQAIGARNIRVGVPAMGPGADHDLLNLVTGRRNRPALFKRLELPLLLAMGLMPSVGLWTLQGRELFAGAFGETLLALTFGITLSWYILSRMKDYANSRHLSYVLPITVTVFTSILAVLALLRVPYSASFFGFGAALAILANFGLAVYARRLGIPHLVIPGGRTDELKLCDNYLMAPKFEVIQDLIDTGHRHWAIVADLHYQHEDHLERLFARAALNGVPVYHYRAVREMQSGQVKINHLSENDLGSLIPNMPYTSIKRAIDVFFALMLLPFCAPLFLVIGLLIKLDSRGPAFFLQKRMGFRCQPFTMVKFRTMRVREASGKPADSVRDAMTTDDDARITKVGAFLRKARIDELPQIFNVLAGHMSFIGPRPEALSLSEWYEEELPFYSYRHIVRPGITGWAQVNQGHVTDVADVLSKLRYDFYYIKHFSLWLDVLTALKTLRVIITGAGAR